MAKNFGWGFYRQPYRQKHNLKIQTLALHLYAEARKHLGLNKGEKIYLKPEHYTDLKPRNGDMLNDGNIVRVFNHGGWETNKQSRIWYDQHGFEIIQRYGKQWFAPKKEAANN